MKNNKKLLNRIAGSSAIVITALGSGAGAVATQIPGIMSTAFAEEVKNVNQQYENQTAEDVGDRNKEVPEENNDSNLEEDELLKNNTASEETKNDHDDKVEQPPKKGFWSRLFGN